MDAYKIIIDHISLLVDGKIRAEILRTDTFFD